MAAAVHYCATVPHAAFMASPPDLLNSDTDEHRESFYEEELPGSFFSQPAVAACACEPHVKHLDVVVFFLRGTESIFSCEFLAQQ